jgi:hypothetical protein
MWEEETMHTALGKRREETISEKRNEVFSTQRDASLRRIWTAELASCSEPFKYLIRSTLSPNVCHPNCDNTRYKKHIQESIPYLTVAKCAAFNRRYNFLKTITSNEPWNLTQ